MHLVPFLLKPVKPLWTGLPRPILALETSHRERSYSLKLTVSELKVLEHAIYVSFSLGYALAPRPTSIAAKSNST